MTVFCKCLFNVWFYLRYDNSSNIHINEFRVNEPKIIIKSECIALDSDDNDDNE